MWDIALRNRSLDRNDGRNVKRSAYVSGSGRDFCDGELNYTGCETSRSETDHWTGTTEGTWNVLRTLREVDAISAMANSTTQNDSQCESFFYLYSLIRCSRITSDEENINKLLSGMRSRVRIIWEAKLHSAKFWACDGKVNQTFAIPFVSNFFIIITYTL